MPNHLKSDPAIERSRVANGLPPNGVLSVTVTEQESTIVALVGCCSTPQNEFAMWGSILADLLVKVSEQCARLAGAPPTVSKVILTMEMVQHLNRLQEDDVQATSLVRDVPLDSAPPGARMPE